MTAFEAPTSDSQGLGASGLPDGAAAGAAGMRPVQVGVPASIGGVGGAGDAGNRADVEGMPPMASAFTGEALRARYHEVKQRVEAAAKKSGRGPASVMLVAVTKYAGLDQVRELYQLGHRDFGESQVQQLIQRSAAIEEWALRQRGVLGGGKSGGTGAGNAASARDAGIRWHMIGRMQRNKSKKVVELCRLVHSVDSLRLAEELQMAGLKLDKTVDILLQVNVSGEGSKAGCAPAAVGRLAEEIMTMANLRIRGLMTMAPHGERPEASRGTFARCRELFEDTVQSGIAGPARVFNILSMGMSTDYEVAISEGANLVRVGSSIVGEPRRMPGEEDEGEEA